MRALVQTVPAEETCLNPSRPKRVLVFFLLSPSHRQSAMDSKPLSEQEKDIRDLLRRAERTPVKTSTLVRSLRRPCGPPFSDSPHAAYPSVETLSNASSTSPTRPTHL